MSILFASSKFQRLLVLDLHSSVLSFPFQLSIFFGFGPVFDVIYQHSVRATFCLFGFLPFIIPSMMLTKKFRFLHPFCILLCNQRMTIRVERLSHDRNSWNAHSYHKIVKCPPPLYAVKSGVNARFQGTNHGSGVFN